MLKMCVQEYLLKKEGERNIFCEYGRETRFCLEGREVGFTQSSFRQRDRGQKAKGNGKFNVWNRQNIKREMGTFYKTELFQVKLL